jgi:hypothetical protein
MPGGLSNLSLGGSKGQMAGGLSSLGASLGGSGQSLALTVASRTNAIAHIEYLGVIPLIEGYVPELSCREHMLRDLPAVLHVSNNLLCLGYYIYMCVCVREREREFMDVVV